MCVDYDTVVFIAMFFLCIAQSTFHITFFKVRVLALSFPSIKFLNLHYIMISYIASNKLQERLLLKLGSWKRRYQSAQ